MKTLTRFFLFVSILFGVTFLQSCNDDDDSDNNPPSTTFPHTVTFSHFEQVEFKMWTNGAEVNTSGLNFLDFVYDEEEIQDLQIESYQSGPGLTFTIDSIFGMEPDSSISGLPYIISNDSIFFQVDDFFGIDSIHNFFFALGSPTHFRLVQGYAQFADKFENSNEGVHLSFLMPAFQTFESVSEHWDIPSLESIEVNDTLLINNRYVHYN